MNITLLEASEARELSEAAISGEDKTQLEVIADRILVEINEGNTGFWYYKDVRPNVKKILGDKGYKIEDVSDPRDGSQFKISW